MKVDASNALAVDGLNAIKTKQNYFMGGVITMEEMKNYTCAICGKIYNDLKDRIECETNCLAEQERVNKILKVDEKKKAKKKSEEAINKELDVLLEQYDKVSNMIKEHYNKYEEDVYDHLMSKYIPRSIFDFIF